MIERMKIFAFLPSYLFVAGDGIHERRIMKGLKLTDQLLIVTVKILPPHPRKLTIASKKEQLMLLPVIRPLIVFDFLYGLLFSIVFTLFTLAGKKLFGVIYVRDTSAAVGLNLLRRCHKIPVVLKLVSFAADEYFMFTKNAMTRIVSWIISTLERVATITSDKVIVPSDLFKNELIRRYWVPESKIASISVGVDVKGFSNSVNSKSSDPLFTVGYFGSLIPLNDIDCLLAALQLLKPQVSIKLLLATRSNPSVIMRKIGLYDLKEFVQIKSVPHKLIPRLMSEVDVVVIPRRKLSTTELVIPLKLLEAGAARKPVVMAKTKIIECTLRDMEHVLMYEPENSDDLAEKILVLYDDNELRLELGYALFDFTKNYDWKTVIRKLRDVLYNVVSANKQDGTGLMRGG